MSSLEASVHFLRENYYSCITEHRECQERDFLPKRIVDVSQSRYRLFEPSIRTEDKYACLSYSWGVKGFAVTTSGNYEELKHGFDREELPIVFRDAAAVVQSLGIRYLWIDTLCIIQDSKVDWEEQAARIGEIFEGATITIAASSSPNPYHSLFRARESMFEEVELYSEIGTDIRDVVFKARRKIDRGIHAKVGRTMDKDPLDTRAWGLQEKLLSTRLLAFTGAEMQWTCRTLRACECHQNPYPSKPLFPAPTEMSSAEGALNHARSWSHVIEEYSARDLTILEDKLPALSGLASKFGSLTGFTYIAGLWRESLFYDLVWQRDIAPIPVPSTWLSPSFSWASASGAVNFRFARHSYPGARVQHAELLDFYYKTSGHDAYSRAVDGSLTLRGRTVAAVLRKSLEDFRAYTIRIGGAVYSPNTDQKATCEFSIDASISHYHPNRTAKASKQVSCETTFNDNSQEMEESVILLSLYSIHHQRYLYQNFLILARSHPDLNTYERIGIGSGKMYRGSGCNANIPSAAEFVRPFEWLSVDLERSGRGIENMVEQVVYIR
jgi:hypothetical protein